MLILRDGSVIGLTDRMNHPAEVLIVGIYQDPSGPEIAALGTGVDARTAAELTAVLSAVGATGKPEEITRVPAPSKTGSRSVVAVGLGEKFSVDGEQIRRSAGAAARALSGVESVVCTMSSSILPPPLKVWHSARSRSTLTSRIDPSASATIGCRRSTSW